MKKFLCVILVLCVIACAGCLAACDLVTKPHTHSFGSEWSKNAEGHWHPATCEHTDERGSWAVHNDNDHDGLCDVCDYELGTPTVSVESVSLDNTTLELTVGGEQTLVATVLPENATDKTVNWESSNTAVATVDENGKVTAITEGTAVITATAGEVSATCQVTVNALTVSVESVTLDKTTLELTVGGEQTLVATVLPENATDKTVNWNSSNTAVATVDENGKVTAITEGTAVITATAGEVSATCQVKVQAPLPTESLTYEELIENSQVIGYTVTGITDKTVEKVVIPSEYNGLPVLRIGNSAFESCSSMKDIKIPDSVTSIRNYAFEYCTGLTSVTIPNSVTSLGSYTFYECTGLTSVNIPDGVTSIGKGMFWRCISLTSINLPDSVTSIGNNAFYACNTLKNLTIPDGVTSIGSQAFYACKALTSVNIPNSVTSLGNGAFQNCNALTSVTIPDGVTSIGSQTFQNCGMLTTINYEGTVEQWQQITKGVLWDKNTGEYTVVCTDGTIAKDETATTNA